MNVDELSKIIQLYMYQNMYSDNNSTSSSSMFETLLMNAIESVTNTNGSSISSEPIVNSLNTAVSDKTSTQSSKNTTNSVSNNIDDAIKITSDKYGIEEEFIKAVIKQESAFNANAVSKSGAQGLMQLMPSTAKSLGVENPFNVLDNIDGGTRYLKRLIDSFDGNKELALSAYNGGIGRMNRLGVDTVEEISKMPRETEKYVSKVMQNYSNYKKL
jgi:soluble lytic murein transglycosylase-like protein